MTADQQFGRWRTEMPPLDEAIDSAPLSNVEERDYARIIERRLLSSGLPAFSDVKCVVDDQVAVLCGSVPSYHAKQIAQLAVMSLKLPLRIENRCKVETRPAPYWGE
jgi:hypothetical protein